MYCQSYLSHTSGATLSLTDPFLQTAGEPAEPEDPQDTTRDNYTETHLITIPKTVADKRGIDR